MPGRYDLVYSAAIDDYTLEWFEEFDDRIDNMKEKTDGAFDGLEKGGTKAAVVMGAVGGAVAMITNQLINMAMASGQAFVGYIKDAAMLSARIETLGVALEVAGAHAGYTREELNKFEEDVKGMGITTSKARIALQQMAQADLDLARAADLARLSQDAAVAAGINSSEAFNRILYAITSLQPEILRNMNLIVNLQAANEKYAKEIGKTVSQLTAADRQQAMLNATMRAGEDIAGTYEAAMDTVGKKLTSLPRYFEEIQLAIGDAFRPALSAGVDILTDKLKDLTKWLEENETELQEFGEDLATFVVWLITMVDTLTNMFTTLPELIERAGFSMAKTLATALEIASPEEMDRRRSLLSEYFAQAITLLVGFAYTGVLHVIELAKTAVGIIGSLFTFLTSDEGWRQLDDVLADHAKRMEEVKRKGQDMMLTMSELTGLMDNAGDATERAAFEFDKAAKDLMNLEEALSIANSRIEDFARSMEDAAAELAIKMARRATEAALRESWAREDMERSHQSRLRAIMEQSSQSKKDVAKRYARSRIDIERDYQRRIRDLQRDFEFQASELARSRDAVGLLKLMRSHDKALKDADLSRKDRLGDAKRAFKEEMKMMNDRIQEQLRRAEEAHRLQLEDFERMKAREREIQALQDKWAEEDRQAQYAKQLAELIIQMGSIEGITQEGLMDLIDLWSRYFGDLTKAATAYMEKLKRVIRPGGGSGGSYVPPGYGHEGPTPRGSGVGQGGRVSQMMSANDMSLAERLYSNVTIPPIPKVPPSDMRGERKEITVKVSGEGLDPYIQRKVANALLEIERNASGG